jgi:hypothetical protein
MDLLTELERRRDKVVEQLREKQSELSAIHKIIEGMQRDGIRPTAGRSSRNGAKRDKRLAKLGLSEAIRAVALDWIAPSDIRNALLEQGYKHTAKSPLLGGVFATCKRLALDGKFEIREMNERKEYRVKPKSESQE